MFLLYRFGEPAVLGVYSDAKCRITGLDHLLERHSQNAPAIQRRFMPGITRLRGEIVRGGPNMNEGSPMVFYLLTDVCFIQ